MAQTLIAGEFCSRETLRAMLAALTTHAEPAGFEPPMPPGQGMRSAPLHIA
ncbi:hypothetical protein D3C78_1506070 [compost metagenome]